MKKLIFEWAWIILAGFFLAYFILSYLIVDISTEPMKGVFTPSILSLAIYKENITFGEVPFGFQTYRFTKVSNAFDFPVRMYFFSRGNISDYLQIYPTSVYFGPEETQKIYLFFSPSLAKSYGEYNGQLIILTRRTIFGI